jgi:hypothetical protein
MLAAIFVQRYALRFGKSYMAMSRIAKDFGKLVKLIGKPVVILRLPPLVAYVIGNAICSNCRFHN